MYSIVETAKANGANVRFYLQYLLEEVPRHRNDATQGYLDDMMPWSDAYHDYESGRIKNDESMLQSMFPEPARPKTRRKRVLLPMTQPGADSPPK